MSDIRAMTVTESPGNIHLTMSPYGTYTLLRNAIDTAALAAWLMQPVNGKLRVKRSLMAEMDEVSKSLECRKQSHASWEAWAKKRRDRMQEVADSAGIGAVNVRKLELPSTTKILKALDAGKDGRDLPLLAVWQLCSGHAHGKRWARLATDDLSLVPGTETGTGAQYKITIKFGIAAYLMLRTVQLMEAASSRYVELAQSPNST